MSAPWEGTVDGRQPRRVPLRALVLSTGALAVPLAGTIPLQDAAADVALLPWIAALIPGFLLSYYRGWRGSAVALAAGMAAIALWSATLALRGLPEPRWERVTLLVAGYLAFCAGLGLVTELLLRERQRAEDLTLVDPLTGLPNLRHMEVFLAAAVSSARVAGSPLSVVLVDVDRFTWLVDKHSRAAGDGVIEAIALLVRRLAAPEWLCGRTGPDEILVIMPLTPEGPAHAFAESVRAEVGGLDVRWQPLTVSVGVASLETGIEDGVDLFSAVRQALEGAKGRGRDRIEVAGRSPGSVALKEHALRPGSPERAPRGIVVLDPPLRETVRKVLELNGLRVEEYDDPSAVPFQGAGQPPAALLVTAAPGREQVASVLSLLEGAVEPTVPRVVFVGGERSGGPLREHAVEESNGVGAEVTLLAGSASGEALLPLMGGLLSGRPGPASTAPSSVVRFPSRLARADAPLTSARIMVVEDDAPTRMAIHRALAGIGFRDVVVYDDGEAALAGVVETPPDLVLLDLHMPGVDGFGVLSALRPLLEGDAFLPVVVVTGDQQWEHRQRVLRMGAKDFLHKPFDVAELGARVLNLLETRRLHLQMRDTKALLEVRVQQRTRELELAKDEILFRLARAAEYRDDMTGRHAARVGVAAAALGRAIGLEEARCEVLRVAAPLHDVGKIAIPDAILLKRGRLTGEEMTIMKRHTTIGADLLARSTSHVIEAARVIALTHHERWDGRGYPRGLRGEQIPIEGRLVAIADAMDALTHQRPYKPAFPFERAIAKLLSESGSAFDPEVAEALRASAFRIRDIVLDRDRQVSPAAPHT